MKGLRENLKNQSNVVVIGTGHWGGNLLRNFHALGALGGLCDLRAELQAKFGAIYPDATLFADPQAVFASPDVHAVVIATPAATHGDLAAQALQAGKHVFVEKPLCLDVSQGKALAEEAERRGLALMVGHLLLYHPAFLALKELVTKGTLGELRYVYSNRLSLGKIRREENALWSFAPHDISMILDLSGAMPRRAMTSGGPHLSRPVADTTLSHLTFEDGLQAHIFVSWLHPYKDHRLVVVGSAGMAAFHDSQPGAEKLLFYPHTVRLNGDIPTVTKAKARLIPYGAEEPLALECRHFLECVTEGRRPRSDAREGLRVLTVLDACQRSLATGQPVEISEVE